MNGDTGTSSTIPFLYKILPSLLITNNNPLMLPTNVLFEAAEKYTVDIVSGFSPSIVLITFNSLVFKFLEKKAFSETAIILVGDSVTSTILLKEKNPFHCNCSWENPFIKERQITKNPNFLIMIKSENVIQI